MQAASLARYSRQQSLVVDRMVDSLALEAATSCGGTRRPAATQAIKAHLHKAAQRLPSLAAASSEPLVSQTEVTQVVAVVGANEAVGVVMLENLAVAVMAEVGSEPHSECGEHLLPSAVSCCKIPSCHSVTWLRPCHPAGTL